jgi:hypothetical protein
MSRSILLRTALVQTLLVGALSVALVVPLGDTFFKHWGWLIGPVAWIACAFGSSLILRLPRRRTLIGAVVAGIPSVIFVIVGLHTLGDVVAIAVFACWCAWRASVGAPAWSA